MNNKKVPIISPKSLIMCLLMAFVFPISSSAQYVLDWAKTLGGKNWDEATCVIETTDRGIVVAGYTTKDDNREFWIVKLSPDGFELWGKTLQNVDFYSEATGIVEMPDESIVVGGTSYPKTRFDSDMWIIKLDKDGKELWNHSFGGENNQAANAITATSDGGFVLAGYTESTNDLEPDFLVMKIDAQGNMVWEELFGGKKGDVANAVVETNDGGIAAAGYTMSKGIGHRVFWVVKMDATGMWEWDEVYNVSTWESARTMAKTSDNGLVIAGLTKGKGHTNYDLRIIKIDELGYLKWGQTFGGDSWEEATGITEAFDKGFVVCGFTKSKLTREDFWILKLDKEGNKEWDDVFGGTSYDFPNSVIETHSNELVVVGRTFTNQLVTYDYAVLKLKVEKMPDNLLSHIELRNPADSLSLCDTANLGITACITTQQTLEHVKFFLNDSLVVANANCFISDSDSVCNVLVMDTVNLVKGRNRLRVEVVNKIGVISEKIRIIYYLLIGKIEY